METVVNIFVSLFGLLTSNSILGMPVLVWLILPAIIVLILKFIKGQR